MLEHDFVDVPRPPDFFADVTSEIAGNDLLKAGLVYFGLICISQALKRLARLHVNAIIHTHVDDLASDQHVQKRPILAKEFFSGLFLYLLKSKYKNYLS